MLKTLKMALNTNKPFLSINASLALLKADKEGKTLSQPRAGVALMDEHIELLKTLQEECDLLPSTIDAYTRLNRYEEAAVGIKNPSKPEPLN